MMCVMIIFAFLGVGGGLRLLSLRHRLVVELSTVGTTVLMASTLSLIGKRRSSIFEVEEQR